MKHFISVLWFQHPIETCLNIFQVWWYNLCNYRIGSKEIKSATKSWLRIGQTKPDWAFPPFYFQLARPTFGPQAFFGISKEIIWPPTWVFLLLHRPTQMNDVQPETWEYILRAQLTGWLKLGEVTSGEIYLMPSWAQTFSNGQCETVESASGSGATRKGVSVVGQPQPSSPAHTFPQTVCWPPTHHCEGGGDKEDSNTWKSGDKAKPDTRVRCHRSLPTAVATSNAGSFFCNCHCCKPRLPTCHGSHISEGCKSLKRYDCLRRTWSQKRKSKQLLMTEGLGWVVQLHLDCQDLFLHRASGKYRGWAIPTTPPSACPTRRRQYSQDWESYPRDLSPTMVKECFGKSLSSTFIKNILFCKSKRFLRMQCCVIWNLKANII